MNKKRAKRHRRKRGKQPEVRSDEAMAAALAGQRLTRRQRQAIEKYYADQGQPLPKNALHAKVMRQMRKASNQ